MTRPRKDRLPVPGRPPKDASRGHARVAAQNQVNGATWVGRLAAQTEADILRDAGELSAGALKLVEIAANEYVNIFLAQQFRLKRIERATCPLRIRHGRGDGLAALRHAWDNASGDERQHFLEARALELQALSADSDKWLLWRIGVFERAVKLLGVKPARIERPVSTCQRCGAPFYDLASYVSHACPAAAGNGAGNVENAVPGSAAGSQSDERAGAKADPAPDGGSPEAV